VAARATHHWISVYQALKLLPGQASNLRRSGLYVKDLLINLKATIVKDVIIISYNRNGCFGMTRLVCS